MRHIYNYIYKVCICIGIRISNEHVYVSVLSAIPLHYEQSKTILTLEENRGASLDCHFHSCTCCCSIKVTSLPSGKHTKNYGKSPFLTGQLTISMAIFKFTNCKRLPGRVPIFCINKPAWDFETSKKPWVSEKNSGIIAGFHAKPGPIGVMVY